MTQILKLPLTSLRWLLVNIRYSAHFPLKSDIGVSIGERLFSCGRLKGTEMTLIILRPIS